jgi:hypothetical protein
MKRLFALMALLLLACGTAFAAEAPSVCEPKEFVASCCVTGDSLRTPLPKLNGSYLGACPQGDAKALNDYLGANFKISPEVANGETIPIVIGLGFKEKPAEGPAPNDAALKCVNDCIGGGSSNEVCKDRCAATLGSANNAAGGGALDGGLLFEIGIVAAVLIVAGGVIAVFFFTRKKEKELVKQMEKVRIKLKSLENSYLTRKIDENTYRKLFEQYQLQLYDLKAELGSMKKKGKEEAKEKND